LNEEKDLDQTENDKTGSTDMAGSLEDFVELDDLQELEGLEDFSGLGDLSDLDVAVAGSTSAEETDTQKDTPEEEAVKEDNASGEGEAEEEAVKEDNASGEEETEEEAVKEEAAEETVEETATEGDGTDNEIESMLDGLLDSLDTNGSIDVLNEEGMAEAMAGMEEESKAAEPERPVIPRPVKDAGTVPATDSGNMGLGSMMEDLGIKSSSTGSPAAASGLEDITGAESGGKAGGSTGGTEEKAKKPGFFKRVFGNVVTDEIAEAERKAKEDEEERAKEKVEQEAKAKAEKEAKKAEKAEAKEAKKAEKAAKKAEKAEEKAAKKAEKAAKKAEEKAAEEQEVVGKLNKAGVIIVAVFAAILLAGVVLGTDIFSYRLVKSEAERYFELQRYSDAYKEAIGSRLEEKEPDMYEKIVIVMKVQQALDKYSNYSNMKYYPDALNALLEGLKKYDENIDTARDIGVDGDLKVCRNKILSVLKDEFGLSEAQADAILSLEGEKYTAKVVSVAKKKI